MSLTAQDAGPVRAADGRANKFIAPLTVPPVANAPFSASAKTVWVQVLPDGSTLTVQNQRVVARDDDGRVFEERRTFVPVSDDGKREPRLVALDYSDPREHTFYRCFPGHNYCELYDLRAPSSAVRVRTGLQPDGTTYITREDQGVDTFADMDVLRSKETTTLYAESVGNTKTILRTCEYWYSATLGVNLQVKRNDPRDGAQTLWLSDISRTAPDPQLFNLPEGYRIIDLRGTGAVPGPVVNMLPPVVNKPR
jgi:hypothetical protein